MHGKGFPVTSMVLAVVMALYPTLSSQAATEKMTKQPLRNALTLKPGLVRLTVLRTEGKPAAGVAVRLLDRKGKLVRETKTDKAGRCVLKGLAAGDYTLRVKGAPALALRVIEKAERSHALLILPARPYAAGQEGEVPTWVWVVVGAVAVAAAITLPIVLKGEEDDEEEVVPTPPTPRRRARRVSP